MILDTDRMIGILLRYFDQMEVNIARVTMVHTLWTTVATSQVHAISPK